MSLWHRFFSSIHSTGIQIIVRNMVKVFTHRRDNIAHTRPTALVFFCSYTYLRKKDAFCWHKSELTATETTTVSCLWSSELVGQLVK